MNIISSTAPELPSPTYILGVLRNASLLPDCLRLPSSPVSQRLEQDLASVGRRFLSPAALLREHSFIPQADIAAAVRAALERALPHDTGMCVVLSLLIASKLLEETAEYVQSARDGQATATALMRAAAVSAAAAPGPVPSATEPASDAPAAAGEFTGLGAEELTARLMQVLGEVSSAQHMVAKCARTLGAAACWSLFQQTLERAGVERVADGTRQRTLGGIFISLAKPALKKPSVQRLEQEIRVVPLRKYQEDAVKFLTDDRAAHLAAASPAVPAHNWVVSAPTGSGKTEIFVSLIRRECERRQEAAHARLTSSSSASSSANGHDGAGGSSLGIKVVVVVPTIPLADQQAAYFKKRGFLEEGWEIMCFSSENQLRIGTWHGLMQSPCSVVIVLVAQVLLNQLNHPDAAVAASLEQVDILVLDECHRTHDKDPYACIMDQYQPPKPWVLGFSASPAAATTIQATRAATDDLLARLHARLFTINEDDKHIQTVAPTATEQVVQLQQRPLDVLIAELLLTCLYDAAKILVTELRTVKASGPGLEALEMARALGERGLAELQPLLEAVQDNEEDGQLAEVEMRADSIQKCTTSLSQFVSHSCALAMDHGLPRLRGCTSFLDMLRKSLELSLDLGMEPTLHYLGCKLPRLLAKADAQVMTLSPYDPDAPVTFHHLDNAPSHSLQLGPTQSPATLFPLSKTARRGAAPAATTSTSAHDTMPPSTNSESEAAAASSAAASSAAASSAAASSAASTAAGYGATLPAPHCFPQALTAKELFAAQSAAAGVDAGAARQRACVLRGSVADVTAACTGLKLAQRTLLDSGQGWLACTFARQEAYLELFPSGHIQDGEVHPKVWSCLDYLVRHYSNKPDFRGIIFVTTRLAVRMLARMLRSMEQLSFVDTVTEIVGHGTKSSNQTRRAALDEMTSRGQGMSGKDQKTALEVFGSPGRRLLIATSTAEEGLDIPTCSFVICYNVSVTGVQRIQRRGRARYHGAQFVSLVQAGLMDAHLYKKSQLEEACMRALHKMM